MHPLLLHPKIYNLSIKLEEKNFLSILLDRLNENLDDPISFGAEIEFYLKGMSYEKISEIMPEYKFFKERGCDQLEYHIGIYNNYYEFITAINNSFIQIQNKTSSLGANAIFHPKYYIDDYGNSLQFQISSKSKIFQNNIDKICSYLCATAPKLFLAYASTKDDYLRFDKRFMAPTHISYGYNNRTCLIRINGDEQKRIEFRAPSPYCNLYMVLSTIILQTFLSFNNTEALNYSRIYGNSFEEQYKLDKLPTNIEEAEKLFEEKLYEIF